MFLYMNIYTYIYMHMYICTYIKQLTTYGCEYWFSALPERYTYI